MLKRRLMFSIGKSSREKIIGKSGVLGGDSIKIGEFQLIEITINDKMI
jgi:hypothetical protein